MTKPQGPRKPCVLCGISLYSTNKYNVCARNPSCRAVNRFLSRNPHVDVSIIPAIPNNCPSCQIPMTQNSGLNKTTASIDKIIPALGYVKGNVSWLCMRCNRLKGNASLTELRNIVAYMERSL